MSTKAAALSLHHVRQQYDGRTVLDMPLFELHAGRIVGIAGPNGSGKSTLLRCLALLERPAAGELRMDDTPLTAADTPRNRRVTLLNQHPYLFRKSVFHNVTYGLRAQGFDGGLKERAAESLRMVHLSPKSFMNRSWYALSGGEAQRVALAARLALRPKVLLLDEPTASLDQESTDAIRLAVMHARDQWHTAVGVVSHDSGWLDELCDEVFWMYGGTISGLGRANVLAGEWQSTSDGPAFSFSDGQSLTAPPLPGETPHSTALSEAAGAALLIAPERIELAESPARAGNQAGAESQDTATATQPEINGQQATERQFLDARLVQTIARPDGVVFTRFRVGDTGLWMRSENGQSLPAAGLRVRLGIPSQAMRWIGV